MEKLIKYLEKELADVENHFDYYDNSIESRRLIESEKRQINRLIFAVKALKKTK